MIISSLHNMSFAVKMILTKTINNALDNEVAKFASKAITVITEGHSIPGSLRDPNQHH